MDDKTTIIWLKEPIMMSNTKAELRYFVDLWRNQIGIRQAQYRDRDVLVVVGGRGGRGGADRESHPATFTAIASAH